MLDDTAFVDHVADGLAALPGVVAVSLGGSRAEGTHRADSDWDVALYYRGGFDAEDLRALGWPGEVFDPGDWGRVFNGGAWLEVDGRPVDVHYRDLDDVEFHLAEARQGRFAWEPLLFHLAGIPGYLVVGELAINRVLRGDLPRPEFPAALRRSAPEVWWQQADLGLSYARANHAPAGRAAQTAGAVAQAACQAAHAVLAARGEWVTNEKRLLRRAGLEGTDPLLTGLPGGSAELVELVDTARSRLRAAVEAARLE
ncbi:nucleotidyltransferase domain-containing protein [Salinifilum aidingensis]